MRRRNSGFTLVEVVVVLAVVAVLASIALVGYRSVVERSQDEVAVETLRSTAASVELLRVLDQSEVYLPEYFEAVGVTTDAMVAGVSAAADVELTWNSVSEMYGAVVWVIAEDPTVAWFAMRSDTGRCAVGSLSTSSGVQSRVAVSPVCDTASAATEFTGSPAPATTTSATTTTTSPVTTTTGAPTTTLPPTTTTTVPAGPDLTWGGWAGTLLAGGDVELSGGASVTGAAHSNGTMNLSGSFRVSGAATATGRLVCAGVDCVLPANHPVSLGSGSKAGAAPVTISAPTATQLWHTLSPTVPHGRLNYAGGNEGGAWFDLCPDGKVRLPDGAGPCQGSLVIDMAISDPGWLGFEGWKWLAGQGVWHNQVGGVHGAQTFGPAPLWLNPVRARASATWYVHEAEARLDGSNGGPITVIASAGSAARSGSITAGGGTNGFSPVLSGLTFVADRDIVVSATAWSANGHQGRIAARGHVLLDGDARFTGPVFAGGATTSGGLITASVVRGAVKVG